MHKKKLTLFVSIISMCAVVGTVFAANSGLNKTKALTKNGVAMGTTAYKKDTYAIRPTIKIQIS